jgi:predicted ATP-grasp superfamily ATP-dependent carboligase
MRSLIELPDDLPPFRDPFLVMHMEGWTDAGMAGETAAVFLRNRWNASTLARFDPDELIDYRARRPIVRIANGVIESLSWSQIELSYAVTSNDRHAILLTGPEPDMRWQAFSDEVASICRELGVTEAFGLGAFPAPALHTSPVMVISTSADPELARRLDTVEAVVELGAGVQAVLEERLHHEGIATMGLWARVPPYLAGGAHPPAALALLRTLIMLTGAEIDLSELESAANDHLKQVESAISERPQIGEFIDQIRTIVEQGEDEPVPTGDEIAAEFERFLSQRQPPRDPDDNS